MAFGANVGESLFGSRTGNVLTKATITMGVIFVANTLLIGVLYAGRSGNRSSTGISAAKPRRPRRPRPRTGRER